ncbi:hypothetical protein CI238_07886, partial [Colletotrichum incanum]
LLCPALSVCLSASPILNVPRQTTFRTIVNLDRPTDPHSASLVTKLSSLSGPHQRPLSPPQTTQASQNGRRRNGSRQPPLPLRRRRGRGRRGRRSGPGPQRVRDADPRPRDRRPLHRGLDHHGDQRSRGGRRGGHPRHVWRVRRDQEPAPQPRPEERLRQGLRPHRIRHPRRGPRRNRLGPRDQAPRPDRLRRLRLRAPPARKQGRQQQPRSRRRRETPEPRPRSESQPQSQRRQGRRHRRRRRQGRGRHRMSAALVPMGFTCGPRYRESFRRRSRCLERRVGLT